MKCKYENCPHQNEIGSYCTAVGECPRIEILENALACIALAKHEPEPHSASILPPERREAYRAGRLNAYYHVERIANEALEAVR